MNTSPNHDSNPSHIGRWLSYVIGIVLFLMPFHAFITVWASSAVGHYTALRLWKELVLAILLVPSALLYRRLFKGKPAMLTQLITVYLLVQLIWVVVAYTTGAVDLKAGAYGLLINCRFFIFFGIAGTVASNDDWLRRHWQKLVFVPALLVIIFGLLQYSILPPDVLRHFGYGPTTIAVSQTIDNKVQYSRVGSTLRGANPFGAYLVLIISLLLTCALAARRQVRWYIGLAASLAALFVTFSRSAWLGAITAAAGLTWSLLHSRRSRLIFSAIALVIVVFAAAATIGLRHNDSFENTVFHTDEHSRSASSSNAGHSLALKSGLHDVLHEPLGRGPGSAGPASTYNNHYPRVAENYYLQVGQETGWLGLGLFIAINVILAQMLWRNRRQPLAAALFASLLGLTVVNMLSHAWADDTLAYVWWGLAGIALAPAVKDWVPAKSSGTIK